MSATLFVDPLKSTGTYQGNLEVRFCKDLPCTEEYAGSPAVLPYNVKILPGNNLTPLLPRAAVPAPGPPEVTSEAATGVAAPNRGGQPGVGHDVAFLERPDRRPEPLHPVR